MRLFKRHSEMPAAPEIRLHVGCGQQALAGWINIDSQPLPGVDRVLDVRRGLPFSDVEAIYAEHFLEHLGLDDALAFLRECRRSLAAEGILRLSTPNLDWVYATHYRPLSWSSDHDSVLDCLQINRAFHGWGHHFLFNRPMLVSALKAGGFANVAFHSYGQSDVALLANLERHETWEDTPELPHVLIAQADGRADPQPFPKALLDEYRDSINAR